MASSLEKRFWSKVNCGGSPDVCWEWTRCKASSGYGQIRINGKARYAHRVSWALVNGAIPDGQWVLHRCDNPGCCNPNHLFLGDCVANNDDMRSKGRGKNPPMHFGVEHYCAKLSEDDVRYIRQNYRPKVVGLKQLADRFGVGITAIHSITSGRTWKHVDFKAGLQAESGSPRA